MNEVCVVVVTYNRYNLLKECLDALLAQTYQTDILVIDNCSNDETQNSIQEDGYLAQPLLQYIRLSKNIGGAGGFYEGMKRAYNKGYALVWLMDDDAEPELDSLKILINATKKRPNYAAYAPNTYIGTKQNNSLSTFGHRGAFDYINTLPAFQQKLKTKLFKNTFAEIDMASFVGILVPKTSIDIIGLPKKEFFIHHDDTEYSIRLATIGKILLCTQGKIYHKEQRQEEKYEKHFLWFKKNRIKFDKLWLKYFGLRNSIFISFKYGKGYKKYFDALLLYLQLVKDIIFYDDNKWTRLVFASNSFFDGIRGHFDNDKPSRILKGKKK